MSATLRYSKFSPFVRKVLVFASEAGLRDTITLEPADVWAADTDIAKDNPLGKIPALQTPDGMFTGSFACCDWLDQQHGGDALIPRRGPERWRVMQLHGLADGAMEAAVFIVNETLRRPKEFVWSGSIERQRGKIVGGLEVLEARVSELKPVDLASITTGCLLGYLDLRHKDLDWRTPAPKLATFYDAFGKRPSMDATKPE